MVVDKVEIKVVMVVVEEEVEVVLQVVVEVDQVKITPTVVEEVVVGLVHMIQTTLLLDLMDGCTVEMDMLIFSTQLQ